MHSPKQNTFWSNNGLNTIGKKDADLNSHLTRATQFFYTKESDSVYTNYVYLKTWEWIENELYSTSSSRIVFQ